MIFVFCSLFPLGTQLNTMFGDMVHNISMLICQQTTLPMNVPRLIVRSFCLFETLCCPLLTLQVLHLEYNAAESASYPMRLFLKQYIHGINSSWDIPSPKSAELATTLGLN